MAKDKKINIEEPKEMEIPKNGENIEINEEINKTEPEPETETEEEAAPEDPLVALKKQYDEMVDRWQRTLAEFDNFRKRTAKEKAGMYDLGVGDAVEKFLPVLDNFERALFSAPNAQDGFYKGIEMIFRQFGQSLADLGVEPIPSEGEAFDHRLHEAVVHVEDENFGQNEIVEELQKGYKYKDKIIRHSMVKVAN